MEHVIWTLSNPANAIACCTLCPEPDGCGLIVTWNGRNVTNKRFVTLADAVEEADQLRASFLGRGWQDVSEP